MSVHTIVEALRDRDPSKTADLLEQLHRQKTRAQPRGLPTLARASQGATGVVGWFADRLEEFHRGDMPELDALAMDPDRRDGGYDRARRLVERLRPKRSKRTDSMESNLLPLQQELRLALADDGVAGGHFDLENQLGRTSLIRLRPGSFHSVETGQRISATLDWKPHEVELVPRQVQRVRVRVTLSEPHPDETIECVLDVFAGEIPLAKIWLSVESGALGLKE